MSAHLGVTLLATLLTLSGFACFWEISSKVIKALPRHLICGILLTVICVAWCCHELILRPIDFLAFLTPTRVIIGGLIFIPLICIYLNNLLCARALGGFMMLWPMPIILLTRDYVTPWRLVPITVGYISLTLGMIAVFHPWTVRIVCDKLSEKAKYRIAFAILLVTAGVLCFITVTQLDKVVGQ